MGRYDRIEDADLPDGEATKRKPNSFVTCYALFQYRQKARRVHNIPIGERHREAVKLMGLLGGDDINSREAKYIQRRINALGGLRADGRSKQGVEGRVVTRELRRRRDPVWITVRKIKRIMDGDRKKCRVE